MQRGRKRSLVEEVQLGSVKKGYPGMEEWNPWLLAVWPLPHTPTPSHLILVLGL